MSGSREHRKVVTVLFCDVIGSTALGESIDAEALQALLARYFERMRGIVTSRRDLDSDAPEERAASSKDM